MKILYISPENTVGILNSWKEIHEAHGHEVRFITFYKNKNLYDDDICLNLPMVSTHFLYIRLRELFFRLYKYKKYDDIVEGFPPTYSSSGILERLFYRCRDWWWKKTIYQVVRDYNLFDYDIYHFEWGLDFFRDSRFGKELKKRGKKIVCHYHGQDMRTRGVIKTMDKLSDLNLTNEIDLLSMHPNIHHIFLPYRLKYKRLQNNPTTIRVCHSPTNRGYKGTDDILRIVNQLQKKLTFEFVLIENLSHHRAMLIKSRCNIFIDQITDIGGWGYGMSTIEAMSLGLCCICKLQPGFHKLSNNPPIISADKNNLGSVLESLIADRSQVKDFGDRAASWCYENHGYENVSKNLYKYYKNIS